MELKIEVKHKRTNGIFVRLDNDMFLKVEALTKKYRTDRSTIIRKVLELGLPLVD